MIQPFSDESRIRRSVVGVCRRMHARGYVSGWAGNVSVRLSHLRVLVTPAGVPKSVVRPDQLVIVDLDGTVLEAPHGLRPTSELPMHLAAYTLRNDVQAVVHAHPVHTVALSVVGYSFAKAYLPESMLALGPIALTPYATPSTTESETAVVAAAEDHDAIVLPHHGSVTLGSTLEEAYLRLETLEHTSQIACLVERMGGGRELDTEQLARLGCERPTLPCR